MNTKIKGEHAFEGDNLLEGGEKITMTNDITYNEVNNIYKVNLVKLNLNNLIDQDKRVQNAILLSPFLLHNSMPLGLLNVNL